MTRHDRTQLFYRSLTSRKFYFWVSYFNHQNHHKQCSFYYKSYLVGELYYDLRIFSIIKNLHLSDKEGNMSSHAIWYMRGVKYLTSTSIFTHRVMICTLSEEIANDGISVTATHNKQFTKFTTTTTTITEYQYRTPNKIYIYIYWVTVDLTGGVSVVWWLSQLISFVHDIYGTLVYRIFNPTVHPYII